MTIKFSAVGSLSVDDEMMKFLNRVHTGNDEAPPIGRVPPDLAEAHRHLHMSQIVTVFGQLGRDGWVEPTFVQINGKRYWLKAE